MSPAAHRKYLKNRWISNTKFALKNPEKFAIVLYPFLNRIAEFQKFNPIRLHMAAIFHYRLNEIEIFRRSKKEVGGRLFGSLKNRQSRLSVDRLDGFPIQKI